MAKKQPKKKDINKKIVDATVDFATDPINQVLTIAGGVPLIGARIAGNVLSKTKVGQKVLKPVKELIQDLKIFKGLQTRYKDVLKGKSKTQIKNSKYLTEKQNSVNSLTPKINELKKLTKNKGFNFNKTNDYKVPTYKVKDYGYKKYDHGGPHAFNPKDLKPTIPNINTNIEVSDADRNKYNTYAYQKDLLDMHKRTGTFAGNPEPTQSSTAVNTAKFLGKEALLHTGLQGLGNIGSSVAGAMLIPKSLGASGVVDEYNQPITRQTGGMYDQMQQYKGGGKALQGGQMQPIPGSDAVEFQGQSHEQGGIMLDPKTEVEDGETMDQVTMNNGEKNDYFFSSHLKLGGQPFSARHKQILDMGGDQQAVDSLAQIQEQMAGRDKGQVAATGGYRESYETGGIKNKEEGDAFRQWINETYPEYAKNIDLDKEGAYDNSYIKKAWEKYGGDYLMGNIKSTFQETNEMPDYEEWSNAWKIKNPDVPVPSEEDMNKMFSPVDKSDLPPDDPLHPDYVAPDAETESSDDDSSDVPYKRRPNIDALTAGTMFGQVLPAVRAMTDSPDYMGEHQVGNTSAIQPDRLGRKYLQRINMNVDRERNLGDLRSMSRFIDNSGLGPAAIANKMAAWGKKQRGDREISAQEARINVGIQNQESALNADIDKTNVANQLQASQFNARQQNALDMFNAQQSFKTDEFNRGADAATGDRRLMGLQSAMTTLAGINKDRLMYNAQDRLAQAISGPTGILTREEIARDLAKAYPDTAPESEAMQKMVEDYYLKMMKANTNQNKTA